MSRMWTRSAYSSNSSPSSPEDRQERFFRKTPGQAWPGVFFWAARRFAWATRAAGPCPASESSDEATGDRRQATGDRRQANGRAATGKPARQGPLSRRSPAASRLRNRSPRRTIHQPHAGNQAGLVHRTQAGTTPGIAPAVHSQTNGPAPSGCVRIPVDRPRRFPSGQDPPAIPAAMLARTASSRERRKPRNLCCRAQPCAAFAARIVPASPIPRSAP